MTIACIKPGKNGQVLKACEGCGIESVFEYPELMALCRFCRNDTLDESVVNCEENKSFKN